mmetsp:Transcript_563/g.1003  ORF Transcript_563/g.1003 Transcript_563/m.1003 type:complete len:330 (-) Transcript_563:1957-2946(-)
MDPPNDKEETRNKSVERLRRRPSRRRRSENSQEIEVEKESYFANKKEKHLLCGRGNGLCQLASVIEREEKINMLSDAIQRSPSNHCTFLSNDERLVIAEAVVDALDTIAYDAILDGQDTEMIESLCDFLDIAPNEALSILLDAFCVTSNDEDKGNWNGILQEEDSQFLYDNDKSLLAMEQDDEQSTESESDDEYLKAGECELCERETKLTLHHLIPKSTWKNMKQRFLNASKPYREGDIDKVKEILDLGDELPLKLLPQTFSCGKSVKLLLASHTAALCRPCHNCVHANHDNMELAERYNTIEKLLDDERIYKFCKWQSKQKPGKYGIR